MHNSRKIIEKLILNLKNFSHTAFINIKEYQTRLRYMLLLKPKTTKFTNISKNPHPHLVILKLEGRLAGSFDGHGELTRASLCNFILLEK